MNQTLRIIGGKFRGKKFHFPLVKGLRPTPDRVKETLFDWLMHDIQNASCLDAFAGSGSLGLEAFSRGATLVILLEHNRKAFHQLEKNVAYFNNPTLQAICVNALTYLQNTSESFDIIFLDPPFDKKLAPVCLEIIQRTPCLKTGGLIYLETDENISINNTYWEMLRQKKAGQVFYSLFRKL